MSFETIILEIIDNIAIIRINRPDALNALNSVLMRELGNCLLDLDNNEDIGAIIITGSEKAFAAGADIKEMVDLNFADVYKKDFITKDWETINLCRKPIIAAVSGFALGGGCELAMMCDFIIASESAKFGQPEIKLGIIPGAGGTQRLVRAIGKSKAMEMVLTGRMMDVIEAEKSGLVAIITSNEELMPVSIKTAKSIASMPKIAVLAAKEAINRSFDLGLTEGVKTERRLFHSLFATGDQKEGMAAFMEKRKPEFKGN